MHTAPKEGNRVDTYHIEVFDGLGVAHIWTVERKMRGEDRLVCCVGTVYGVHTVDEARLAWSREQS